MKKILLGLATISAITAISFSACGSDACATQSKCSADTKKTDAEIKTCQDNAAKVTTCKTESDAYSNCTIAQQACGTDNKTDGTKTLANITANCKTQLDAYTKCTTSAVVDAGANTGG